MSHTILHLVKRARFRRIFAVLITVSILLGWLVVILERNHPSASIITNFDGLWWSVTTITTVGYGDLVPVTTAGKIVGIFLQFFGVLMYGSIIAMVGMALNRKQNEYQYKRILSKLDSLETKLSKLSKESEFLVKNDRL